MIKSECVKISVNGGFRLVSAAAGVVILTLSSLISWRSGHDSGPRIAFALLALMAALILVRIPFLSIWVDRDRRMLFERGWVRVKEHSLDGELRVERVAYQGALDFGYSRGYFSVIAITRGASDDEDDVGILWTLGGSSVVQRSVVRITQEIDRIGTRE